MTNKDLFFKHLALNTWIETGSCFGRSITEAVELGFSDIRSVEAKPERYAECVKLFSGNPGVKLWLGESVKMLPEMLAGVNHPALFWLDAHPSGEDSYNIGNQSQILMLELAMISNHPISGHVILIDDLTADVDVFAKTLFPTAQITVYDTDEGPAKVMEIKTMPSERVHVSQFQESEIILNFFGGHVGQLIDLGASGGVALSNSFELGLRGWRGLLVEASPIHFQNLVANYHHRGGFTLLNAAFWHERKLMQFHLNQQFLSSLVPVEEIGRYCASYFVNTVTAEDLKALQPIADFISVDLEGADLEVFPSLISAYPDCKLVCCEHAKDDALKARWHEMFERYGLHVIATTPENFLASK